MLRDFINISQVLWLFLLGCLVWLCMYNWTENGEHLSGIGFCGTVSTVENTNPEFALGKKIFRSNCASCHAGDMRTNLTGPPLLEGLKTWAAYPQTDLFAFIRNSQASIANRHPRALEIWEEYRPTVMNSFENLTDEELEALLNYIHYFGK